MSNKEEQTLLEEQRRRSLNMGEQAAPQEKTVSLDQEPQADPRAKMTQQAADIVKGQKMFGGLGELTEEKKEKMESFLQDQMQNLEQQIKFLESEFGNIDEILSKSGFPGGMDELKSTLSQLSKASSQPKEEN